MAKYDRIWELHDLSLASGRYVVESFFADFVREAYACRALFQGDSGFRFPM